MIPHPRHLLLAVAFASAQVFAALVTPYSRPPQDLPDSDYLAVTVDGVPVDTVGTTMGVGYAHFAVSGTAKIEIQTREAVTSFDLSPHRAGLRATATGNTLSFELDRPRKLHLRVNGLRRFFLFADSPESDAPSAGAAGVYSLTDFGVASDPERPQTGAIQKALDEVASKKGVLLVPPGIYRSGRLLVPSNLSLYLSPGSVIKGTGRLSDYTSAKRSSQQLMISDAENVRIFGRGVIDGHGLTLRQNENNIPASRGRLISMLRSRHVSMDGIILREAPVWAVHPAESEDLRFTNLKVISQTRAEWTGSTDDGWPGSNTDAFDPDNSSRVLIEDSFVSVDDDGIAVKLTAGKRRDIENIVFRRNVVWTMCSALKLGTEIHDRTIRDVEFSDNDVVNADVGIAAWCWRGGTIENARWINNHFEGIGVLEKASPHKKETNIRLSIRNVNNAGLGHIRDLLIKDNTFERFSPNDSMLQGLDDEHLIKNVVFENLVIAGRKCMSDEDARMTVGRFTDGVVFR